MRADITFAFLAFLVFSAFGDKNVIRQTLQTVQKKLKEVPKSHLRVQGAGSGLTLANYTSYMHIYTTDGNNPANNWNATIVEYFLKLPNGDSVARDDNFLISFASGTNAEDMAQFNFCYATEPMQDSYIISYPVNASLKSCMYTQEPNYDQGCVSYFENLPITEKQEENCISPYTDEEGDNYVLNFPGVVYLQYCLKKSQTRPTPLYFKSVMNNVTMIVLFALFSDEAPPQKAMTIPEFCPSK